MDWWSPFGTAGSVDVVDRVAEEARERVLATGDGAPLRMTAVELAGREVSVVVEQARLTAYAAQEALAVVELPPAGALLGRRLTLDLREERGRAGLSRREWVIADGEHEWTWHGPRLGSGQPGLRRGGTRGDVVTVRKGVVSKAEREDLVHARFTPAWSAAACPADVLLSMMVTLADLNQALHGRLLRAAEGAMSVAMVVADMLDEDGEVTHRPLRRVSRLPAAAPPPDPRGPSSAR